MVWSGIVVNEIKAGAYETSKAGTFIEMSAGRQRRLVIWGVLLAAALTLGGCSSTIADLPVVGTPADAPARPKEAGAYLPVHDLPPDRDAEVIPPKERAKIEAELIAARNRQAVNGQASTATPQNTINSQNSAAK
jgi:hypothetical protein